VIFPVTINWTYADKFIVSVLGSVSTYLATPNMTWREGVILGITSILVWLVPNTSTPIGPVASVQPITTSERTELEALRAERDSA
jgi:hypothetical protein